VQINSVSLLLINFRKFTDNEKVSYDNLKRKNHELTWLTAKSNIRAKKVWMCKGKGELFCIYLMHEQIKFSGAQQTTEAKKESSTDFSKTNEVAISKLC